MLSFAISKRISISTAVLAIGLFTALAACGGGGGGSSGGGGGSSSSSSSSVSTGPGTIAIDEAGGLPAGYSLKWQDNFDTDGLPDSTKWSYDTFRNKDGWFNNEKQYYSDARLENSRIEGGNLIIEARKEDLTGAADWGGQHYTSARLLSKFTYKYGYIESRLLVPCGLGSWPAFWQLPAAPHNAWPDDGELDIMEYVGWNPDKIYHTVHTKLYNGGNGQQKGVLHDMPAVCGTWHTYSMEWTPTYVKIGTDGRNYLRYNNDGTANYGEWPFDNPQFVILNLAVGGDFGGATGVNDTTMPWKYMVDYVRIYQKD